MSNNNTISVTTFDDISWIRCEGKGTFSNSPLMKSWAESQISNDIKTIVIDLEECTYMDSTFMGSMAGIAMKLAKKDGKLQVCKPSDKSRRSLEDLGLSMLIEIDPADATWQNNLSDIRASLTPHNDLSSLPEAQRGNIQHTAHVYEAHKTLCDADKNNDQKFSTVLDVLEAELANRQASNIAK